MDTTTVTLDKVLALAKRRGFIYPSSEIYGGMANTYDFGPYGAELLRNIRNTWWDNFVTKRPEIYGMETSVLMNAKVWEASGHTSSFSDALIECKHCHRRTRADHLIENHFARKNEPINVEGSTLEELNQLIRDNHIVCPTCGAMNWTEIKRFNLLFATHVGIVPENQSLTYLRGETAQGMFVNFKQIMDTLSPRLPFGLAQSGKVYRNEITLGQGIFRTLEFDLAEFEYFIKPDNWQETFEYWKQEMYDFAISLGINPQKLRWRQHGEKELSHYSSRTEDLEYELPGGFKEWFGLAYRSDYDLVNHSEKSGTDLRYFDPLTNERFFPHVIEPTFGLSRTLLILLLDAYYEETGEKPRTVLKIKSNLAPVKVAVFPLLKNKPELVEKAKEIYDYVRKSYVTVWDERGNIGKRYYAQDEIGTPLCVTIDFDTLKDSTVTLRDRDTAKQERVSYDKLISYIESKVR